jgi:sugar lactone lactonase YvrE
MSSLSRGAFAAVTAFAVIAVIAAGAAPAVAAAPGHVTALAPVSSPGYPALPHVVGDRVYEGTYDNPKGDSVPSRVFEYSLSGALVQTFTVAGQDLSHPHGIQVAANDALGRLMLLDKTSGRIIRLDPRTGVQSLYSRVPDLPVCSASSAGTPCSPALVDQAPMPDYAAWGPDGELYVTDYQQAVIWRIPPGGGEARIWLADRRLDGGPFGTACITMMPDGHTLLFDQASNGGLGTLTPSTGKLYTVAIAPNGDPGPLRQLWESGPGDAPDGCALATSRHIYVALVGSSNQVVELSSTGQELARFGQQYTGVNDSPVPFDSPSGVAFLGSQLLIANQSYFAGDPANQVVLDLETGEPGQPVYVPARAGLPPAAASPPPRHRTKPRHHRAKHHRAKHHKAKRHHHRAKPHRHHRQPPHPAQDPV